MRVIAGIARSLPLKTPDGLDTRPTSDKTKETLFNVLMPYLSDCRFLDLFSGSGGIGIEAISRGAQYAVFVEKSRTAIKCIEDNLNFTKFLPKSRIMTMDAMSALRQLNGREKFDIIFMDPPYNQELEKDVLTMLASSDLLNEDAVIVAEASNDTDFSYVSELGFSIWKVKKYKTNSHVFLKRE